MHKRMSLLLLAGLVLLPGCLRVHRYKRVPLRSIAGNWTYRAVRKNIIVKAKLLNAAERYMLFNERIQNLYGYDTIYISINNLSNIAYVVSSDSVTLEQIGYRQVAKLMKTPHAGANLVGSTFAGFYAAGVISAFIRESATAGGVGDMGFVFVPLFVLSSVITLVTGIKGIKSFVMNSRVSSDLEDKILHKAVVIQPGDHYEKLIFVESSYYAPQFNLTIDEDDNRDNKITFEVDLKQV